MTSSNRSTARFLDELVKNPNKPYSVSNLETRSRESKKLMSRNKAKIFDDENKNMTIAQINAKHLAELNEIQQNKDQMINMQNDIKKCTGRNDLNFVPQMGNSISRRDYSSLCRRTNKKLFLKNDNLLSSDTSVNQEKFDLMQAMSSRGRAKSKEQELNYEQNKLIDSTLHDHYETITKHYTDRSFLEDEISILKTDNYNKENDRMEQQTGILETLINDSKNKHEAILRNKQKNRKPKFVTLINENKNGDTIELESGIIDNKIIINEKNLNEEIHQQDNNPSRTKIL